MIASPISRSSRVHGNAESAGRNSAKHPAVTSTGSTMGASQSALSIQKPSQTGPRTHSDEHFRSHGAAVPISSTAAGEESSAIRAAECAVAGALGFIVRETPLSLDLHVNAAASGVDINAFLR
jgi:hypothetical protein